MNPGVFIDGKPDGFNGKYLYDKSTGIHILIKGDILNQASSSDSILQLYNAKKEGFIDDIDGSFSIVIQDQEKIILIRDRCGTKPLFYLDTGKNICFSDSLNDLISCPDYKKAVNFKALNNFLSYGYIPNPDTMFKGIKQVKPGYMVIYKNGQLKEKQYWKFQYKPVDRRVTEKEYIETFLTILERAVSNCLKKHPDAGAFLSGGLDTSGVVALMHKISGNSFKVFTAGFHEKEYNEIDDAKILSRHLNLEHYTTLIDFTDNFPEFLQMLVQHHEEPFSDTSAIPSYHVAGLAKQYVDTVLTGDFPDQLIGGSGHQIKALNREHTDPFYKLMFRNKVFNKMADALKIKAGSTGFLDKLKRALYRETFSLEEQRILLNMPVPPHLKQCLYSKDLLDINLHYNPLNIARGLYKEVKDEPLLNKILYFDILSYAPDDLATKVNRMCSANNLNALSPFHNLELMEFCAGIPVNMKIRDQNRKYIMREALRPLLPAQTLNKKKQGFAMPMEEWLITKMAGFVQEILLDSKTLNRGYFDKSFLRNMVSNYINRKTDYATGSEGAIISLVTLEIWHRLFIDR